MNIEQLRNAWIAAGQKVSDLQNQIQTALVDDSITVEAINDLKNKLETAKAKRDLAKEQYDDMAAEAAKQAAKSPKEPLSAQEKDWKDKFVNDFKGMIKGDPQIKALLESNLDANGDGIGLTIPQDIQTAINTLKRQYDALEQYVNVIPVSTLSGSRNLEKWTDVTPLENLDDENDTINDNDDPQLTIIKYLIQRYGGISTLTNSLLKDTAENIIAWVTQWIAKKSTVTRNAKIIATLETLPDSQKKTVAKIDDIKDIYNVELDPAIKSTTLFYTNQSGFNVLDKVKDAFGNYVIQPMVCCDSNTPMSQTGTQMSSVPSLFGKRIIVISDKWLPNGGTAQAPVYPLYIGDMKEAIALFDREQLSLATTTEGAGAFEKDQTKIRVIDRFDVKLWDSEAIVKATFTAIADQAPSATTTASTGS